MSAVTPDRPLPKRFYKSVTVMPLEDGFTIGLDGRPIKTPMKAPLKLADKLAEVIAAEWDAQADVIDPARMPLTKLANTVIDRVTPERARIIAEIMEFAAADLTCYRAESPQALVEKQVALWDPPLRWAASHGAAFEPTTGILHKAQKPEALEAFRLLLARLNDWQLCAAHNLTTLTGSAVLAAALSYGAITPDAAWAAAHADEDFQSSQWGEDAEAMARRAARRDEFDATMRFLSLSQ